MRFIVKEQPYEKPIASGHFRYEWEGRATGAVERWRMSQATAGYEVLRVDLDARDAASGHSYLYHLVRQTNGRPERLSYRFWGEGLAIEGTLLFSETSVTGTRTVNGRTHGEDLDITPESGFWFPSAIGLGLAVHSNSGTAVTLNSTVGEEDTLALKQTDILISKMAAGAAEMTVAGRRVNVSLWQIQWEAQTRWLRLSDQGWPVHMQRDDGLTAVETQYIWY